MRQAGPPGNSCVPSKSPTQRFGNTIFYRLTCYFFPCETREVVIRDRAPSGVWGPARVPGPDGRSHCGDRRGDSACAVDGDLLNGGSGVGSPGGVET
jgi:hypothetical protein